MYYAAIGIVAIMIHLILNHEYFRNKEEKTEANKFFKRYIWVALIYYVTDVLWGIIYEFHIPTLIYIDTVLYYVAMALTVVLLCRYVTTYLKLTTKFGSFINYFGLLFGVVEVAILFLNHFVHIFFWIDDGGVYHAYTLRYVALYMQVLLCTLLALHTGYIMRKTSGAIKRRFITIFLFCIEMTIAIIVQILYPLLPLYSVGLVVGIAIIHTFVKEGEKEEQYRVLSSMADIFYSMHVIDLVNDTVVEFNAKDEVKEIVNHRHGAVEMMVNVMSRVTVEEYLKKALEFTDLTTVAERMKNKKQISAQFEGKHTGWFLAMFITIEKDHEGKPTKIIYTTRVIDEEKKQEEKLIRKSQTDELTGLYNRRAYEEDIYAMKEIPDEFIYIALDVNGLKIVNDTIGHEAGDELIKGASNCMKRVFSPYGKVYRTGGDEFVATVIASEEKLKELLDEFDTLTSEWSGKLIENLSVSYGYVSKEEHPDYSGSQFATEADKRMYAAKSVYYQKKGMDRRGQQDAHRALCEAYTKILKINLTEDTYQIVNMYEDEKDLNKGFSDKISTWLEEFGRSGQVHAEDLADYLEKTDINYMREYFGNDNTTHIITYRRKYGDKYKKAMMEMIPANDYSNDNQSLFLYVKNIEK